MEEKRGKGFGLLWRPACHGRTEDGRSQKKPVVVVRFWEKGVCVCDARVSPGVNFCVIVTPPAGMDVTRERRRRQPSEKNESRKKRIMCTYEGGRGDDREGKRRKSCRHLPSFLPSSTPLTPISREIKPF